MKVLQLKAYQYHYLDNNADDQFTNGFMAQEVESIFPQFVSRTLDTDGKEILGLNYSQFAVLAIKAIQEQQEMIYDQQKKNHDQEKTIKDLINMVTDMEKRIQALEGRSNK